MIIEQCWQDLRLALRGLARAKAFTGAAVLTLAVGIAGTTTMFALIQGVLLRPLPVRDQERVIVAWTELRASGFSHWPFRPIDIDTLGRASRLLDGVAGVDYNGVLPVVSVENGSASFVQNISVTGSFFAVLGAEPILGRALRPGDDVTGAENVVVISHGLWQRRYGGSRDVIGRTLPLQDRPFTIVGVMPAAFEYPRGTEAWLTVAASRTITNPRFAAFISVDLIGRRRAGVTIDPGVILFTIVVALLTAALAGFAPALSSSRTDLASQLRSGGRGAIGRGARHGRRALVVAQVALAVTVVAAAGLLTRSLLWLQTVDLGLASDRLVFVQLELPRAKYADPARTFQLLDDLIAQFGAVPGIAAATPINTPPFAGVGGWDVAAFTAEGQAAEQAASNSSLNFEAIEPGYFTTFEVPLVRGRAFSDTDRHGTPLAAIVSEDVAARTWPGVDPIGRRMKVGGVTSTDPWRTIVGIAKLTRYRELAVPRPTLYLPARQFDTPGHMIALRTSAPLSLIATLARERVHAVDPNVQVTRVVPFGEMLERPLARPRFNALLIGLFGIAALLLAAIGLYAVMAAYVRQRYTEIGVRVALGATASDVRRLVLGEGLRLAALGAAIGLGAAMAATRLLRGLLFGVQPLDPTALLAAALLLVGASALGSYLPARRAVRVDPVTLLRAE